MDWVKHKSAFDTNIIEKFNLIYYYLYTAFPYQVFSPATLISYVPFVAKKNWVRMTSPYWIVPMSSMTAELIQQLG